MTVIEAARVLGEVVQADERYKEYVKCKDENDKDEALQNLIGEFNLVRQNLAMESDKPDGERKTAVDEVAYIL